MRSRTHYKRWIQPARGILEREGLQQVCKPVRTPTTEAHLSLISVVENLRLADGTLFSIPVNLDVSKEQIEALKIVPGARIALRDPRDDQALAIITGML